MTKEKSTLIAHARAWTQKQGLHGPHAFVRYVMFVFVEALNEADDREFVLKGGNLLWVLIRTPRSTVDLDFVTRQLRDHQSIKRKLDTFCESEQDFGLKFPQTTTSILIGHVLESFSPRSRFPSSSNWAGFMMQ